MNVRKKFSIAKNTLDAALADLPTMEALTLPVVDIDIFICAAGFEERIIAVPSRLKDAGTKIKHHTLVGRYGTNPEDNKRREEELFPILDTIGSSAAYFDADSPEDIHRSIQAAISSIKEEGKLNIAIDISGGSSTFIVSALISLLKSNHEKCITIFYSTAEEYHTPSCVSDSNQTPTWTESDLREFGVGSVITNELTPGIHHDHLPSYAVVIPSMFTARVQRGLSYLGLGNLSGADNSVFWILPSTNEPKHQWRQKQIENSVITMMYGENAESNQSPKLPEGQWAYCDALSYIECVRTLMTQIDTHTGHNISIIHAGTKLQAIGVSLALAARSEVSAIKTSPQSFSADSYSKGTGEIYHIKIDHPREIISTLTKVGSLRVENGQ